MDAKLEKMLAECDMLISISKKNIRSARADVKAIERQLAYDASKRTPKNLIHSALANGDSSTQSPL